MRSDTIQHVLGLAAPLAVIIGVSIALLQLRSQHRVRRMEIVMRLYSTFGEKQFQRYFRRLNSWNADSPPRSE